MSTTANSKHSASSSKSLNSSSKPLEQPSLSLMEINDQEKHPLFNMAIVEKVQQKIPVVNQFKFILSDKYSQLKSSTGLIGQKMDQMENKLYSIASTLMKFVPKQPVEMVDHFVCNGLDLIENRVVSLSETSKQIRDGIIQVPLAMLAKIFEISQRCSDSLYQLLDLLLTMIETQMDRYWPVKNEDFGKPMEMNGGEISNYGMIGRLIKRFRQFFQHFQIHLMNYVENNQWFCRIMVIFNPASLQPSLKPSESSIILLPKPDVGKPLIDVSENRPAIVVEIVKQVKQSVKVSPAINGDLNQNAKQIVLESAKKSQSNGNTHQQQSNNTPPKSQSEKIDQIPSKVEPEIVDPQQQQILDVINKIVNNDKTESNDSVKQSKANEEILAQINQEQQQSSPSFSSPSIIQLPNKDQHNDSKRY